MDANEPYITFYNDGRYHIGPTPVLRSTGDASSPFPEISLQPQLLHPAHLADNLTQPVTAARRRNVPAEPLSNKNSQSSTYGSPSGISQASTARDGHPLHHRHESTCPHPVHKESDLRDIGPAHLEEYDRSVNEKADNDHKEEGTEDGGENGGENENGDDEEGNPPPEPVGFWDPSLNHVRKEALWKWALTTAILMTFILSVLSIYWGTLFRVERNLHVLTIAVVDFDGQVAPYNTHPPLVGPLITRLALQHASQPHNLGYITPPASTYNFDPLQVRQAVYDFKVWAAIIINPNATAMLYSAIEAGNSSYDPRGACQLVYQDARDDTNWYDFIYPLVSGLITEGIAAVGAEWVATAMGMAAGNETVMANLQRVPQAISPGIGFSVYNLRPFFPYQTIPAVSVGLIYLIILSFFSFPFYLPIHARFLRPDGHPPLKFHQLVIWRWFATVTAYLFMSCAYSIVSLAFQINFSGGNPISSDTSPTLIEYRNPDAYGRATFPVYWMLNFVGMAALGLACENMAMLIGQPWMGLWLIFWVITNVCTAFYDVAIEPAFYRWGYAWPLHNIVEGSRQVLFGLHSRIGLNFGVLFAWVGVNTVLFPLCCLFMRYKIRNSVRMYWE